MRARLFLIFLLFATPAFAEPITGRASVIDGDTLDVRGTRIQLHGGDAPTTLADMTGRAVTGRHGIKGRPRALLCATRPDGRWSDPAHRASAGTGSIELFHRSQSRRSCRNELYFGIGGLGKWLFDFAESHQN